MTRRFDAEIQSTWITDDYTTPSCAPMTSVIRSFGSNEVAEELAWAGGSSRQIHPPGTICYVPSPSHQICSASNECYQTSSWLRPRPTPHMRKPPALGRRFPSRQRPMGQFPPNGAMNR